MLLKYENDAKFVFSAGIFQLNIKFQNVENHTNRICANLCIPGSIFLDVTCKLKFNQTTF